MGSTARWTSGPRPWVTAWLLAGLIAALGLPAAARAHGPVDPAASSYQARVGQVPQGWYPNQVPAQTPPLGLTARTPPRWQPATARAPGATFIGHWSVPLRVSGVPTAITGGLHYAPAPSGAAIWEGATLVGTLVDGFVLLALPAFPVRLVGVASLERSL